MVSPLFLCRVRIIGTGPKEPRLVLMGVVGGDEPAEETSAARRDDYNRGGFNRAVFSSLADHRYLGSRRQVFQGAFHGHLYGSVGPKGRLQGALGRADNYRITLSTLDSAGQSIPAGKATATTAPALEPLAELVKLIGTEFAILYLLAELVKLVLAELSRKLLRLIGLRQAERGGWSSLLYLAFAQGYSTCKGPSDTASERQDTDQ